MMPSSCQRLSLFVIAAACAALFAPNQTALARPQIAKKIISKDKLTKSGQKDVEVVFVLDTTSSMGGLIDGAKRKIWFVANEILKAKQQPHLKIGLVAFRDRDDAYLTETLPLTDDLDKVYATLMAFQVAGGGDFPEDVNSGLKAAVQEMAWSSKKDTLKMIFLVGDAPPHMDYDEVKHQKLSKDAITKNIYINTLQCGSHPQTKSAWERIALNSEGRFAQIPQDGGVRVVVTPFDDELGRLAKSLDTTYLDYGSRSVRKSKLDTRSIASGYAMTAPSATRAERALAKNKAAPRKSVDLVTLYAADGNEGLDKVAEQELDDTMKKMSTKERRQHVKKLGEKRKKIQQKIAAIEKKRVSFIDSTKKADTPVSAFDAAVITAIHKQAKEKGMSFE